MIKLLWTSHPPSRNHALLFHTSTILIPPSPFFKFWYFLWDNSSMTNPAKPTSSCPEHFSNPSTMTSFALLQPSPKNPSNMSSHSMKVGEWSNMSSANRPLILVVRRSICENRSMIFESSLQNTLPLLSTGRTFYVRTLSFPDRMFLETSYLNKFLPNSLPVKVFLLFLETSTPVFLIFNFNVVVRFSITKTP